MRGGYEGRREKSADNTAFFQLAGGGGLYGGDYAAGDGFGGSATTALG